MGWIVKIPKRSDFCGVVGCPLCFDWGQDMEMKNPTIVEKEEEEEPEVEIVIITGVEKMAEDMLGRAPTKAEKKQLDEAAERIHIGNHKSKLEQIRVDADAKTANEEKWVGKSVQLFLNQAAKAKEYECKPLNTVTIDDMDPEKVKEACGMTAPVGQELIEREKPALTAAKKKALAEQDAWMKEAMLTTSKGSPKEVEEETR